MSANQRSLPMDSSPMYGQGIMQSKPGIANAGTVSVNKGIEISEIVLTKTKKKRISDLFTFT